MVRQKWDAIGIHPYACLDGTRNSYDLDKEMQYLIDLMKKYGYGKETPIIVDEAFGGNFGIMLLPEWKLSKTYAGPNPSYDMAEYEYLQACLGARWYIIGLKHWPQLQNLHSWTTFIYQDIYLTPLFFVKAVNTLGNLFQNPTFVADVRPANGMRGYVFKENGKGLAAVWCTLDKVEDGYQKGPVMRVKFAGKTPELIDLMGNVRPMNVKTELLSFS